jgi:hypothetical protein
LDVTTNVMIQDARHGHYAQAESAHADNILKIGAVKYDPAFLLNRADCF